MSGGLTLTVTTPLRVAVNAHDVAAIRAEDASGGFGILPGHADLLTVLAPSVLRWRGRDGIAHYCALRGGVLRVTGGGRKSFFSAVELKDDLGNPVANAIATMRWRGNGGDPMGDPE